MLQTAQKLSKKQRRILRQQGTLDIGQKLNFNLKRIDPLTENQKLTFEHYHQGKNLLLHGIAGTGKSFIAIYLALKQILDGNSQYKKLCIIRSVVPTREVGFMPGSDKQKIKVYEAPYYAICEELFERGDAYEYLKNKNVVEFISTSFIRGITLNDSICIVDEMQNMDWGELSSVITRIGKNCKVIFCGDFRQSDFRYKDRESKNDIIKFIQVIKNMKSDFEFVEFQIPDIVRSRIVKNFIISAHNLGYE